MVTATVVVGDGDAAAGPTRATYSARGVSLVNIPRDFALYESCLIIIPGYPMCPLATRSCRWWVGFALGYYNASIAQYADLRVMTEAYTAVHKMLFSVAYA
ncbi:hypothetical protein ARSEF1564_002130 [Beauveria bassiana]